MTRLRGTLMMGVLVALAVAAPAQAQDEKAKDAAQAAAEKWLALVDAGDYGASWEQAAAYFKKAVTQEQWKQATGAFRQPLGPMVSRKLRSRSYSEVMPGAPDGKYVVIQYTTDFGNKKGAVETVTPMLDPDGAWRVSGYLIK
jgi:hypothetical protein